MYIKIHVSDKQRIYIPIYISTARVNVNNIHRVYITRSKLNRIEQNESFGDVFVRRFPLRFDLVPLTPNAHPPPSDGDGIFAPLPFGVRLKV